MQPGISLEALSARLVEGCATDSCKSYRIFEWVARNIAYDLRTLYGETDPYAAIVRGRRSQPADSLDAWYTRQVAGMVLRARKGICDGYSTLYLELGRLAGLRVVKIEGCAKVDTIGTAFEPNHAWNAVQVDGHWQLLDACWAAGPVSGRKFIRRFEPFFYNTPPEQFIASHYPDSLRWSLLRYTPPKSEFFSWPLTYPAYFGSGMAGYFPRTGLLRLRRDSVLLLRSIGRDTVVVPDIAYRRRGGEIVPLFERPRPVASAKLRTAGPIPSKPLSASGLPAADSAMAAGKRGITAVEAIDTAGAYAGENVAETEEPPAYRIYRNVFEYRLKLPPDITELYFFRGDTSVLRYAVELID